MASYRKIDPVFKQKWLKALRSGKYKQADGALVRGINYEPISVETHEFCCLGVAGDLLGKGKKTPIWNKKFYALIPSRAEGGNVKWIHEDETDIHILKDMGLLPKELAEKIGLTAASSLYLADLNDQGEEFPAIADWIESHL